MQIGAMNNPSVDVLAEVRDFAPLVEFIDLTLEPPAASAHQVQPKVLKDILAEHRLGVVGHTAYYLPVASPFESVRRAAVDELRRCLEVFAAIGARWMNIHPDGYAPMHDRSSIVARNVLTLEELSEFGAGVGVGIMVENLPGAFNTPEQLAELLDPLPALGLHLDIGHANLEVEQNTAIAILAAHGPRLRHVHLHDNKGGRADLHLPLGVGTMDVAKYVSALKQSGYDATITLEVFTRDRHYLTYSRDVLRRMWNSSR